MPKHVTVLHCPCFHFLSLLWVLNPNRFFHLISYSHICIFPPAPFFARILHFFQRYFGGFKSHLLLFHRHSFSISSAPRVPHLFDRHEANGHPPSQCRSLLSSRAPQLSWHSSSLNRRLFWRSERAAERGQLLAWMLNDSCCPLIKHVHFFKGLVCNGVSATGLSFPPNSAFFNAMTLFSKAPHLMYPYCGNHTLPGACTRMHTYKLQLLAAAGVSERQKWPIFSAFHLNNKQGVRSKLAVGKEKQNCADKSYCESGRPG